MSPRRLPPGVPILGARQTRRDLGITIFAYCEGLNTEDGWLVHLRQRCRNIGVNIESIGGSGVPMTIAELAVSKRRSIRIRDNTLDGRDEIWAVFDRDRHPRVPEAIARCRKAGVGVAFSNACFELWPLLHLKEIHANYDRSELQDQLHALHPVYHHDHGARADWDQLVPFERTAIERALHLHRLIAKRQEEPFQNPYTTAWLLHERLLHASDRSASWLVDRSLADAMLVPLMDDLAEPLRSRAKALFDVRHSRG